MLCKNCENLERKKLRRLEVDYKKKQQLEWIHWEWFPGSLRTKLITDNIPMARVAKQLTS